MTCFRIESIDRILLITLDCPERLNALQSTAHFALSEVFDSFDTDRTHRVAVITGAGNRAFCAGNDLKFQAAGGVLDRPLTGFAGIAARLNRRKPVIAAVNGIAAGGGCEIVTASDIAVAAHTATFAFPEVKVGLVAANGIHHLIRKVAMKNALGMLLTGRALSAEEALRIGLVNETVAQERVLTRALEWATMIAEASPTAVRTTLDVVSRSSEICGLDAATKASYSSLERLPQSPDFTEGPRAFSEKRRPLWQDLDP